MIDINFEGKTCDSMFHFEPRGSRSSIPAEWFYQHMKIELYYCNRCKTEYQDGGIEAAKFYRYDSDQ